MTLPTVEKLIDLKESNRLSSQKDFDFAESLLSYAYKHGDLTEKQFKRIYQKASNIKGDTSQILIELLESS